ncbi:hypothetical protein [Fundidesulfovibrio terrae]|uniref:hypothetical protein n=1 Tax=Fundidesulfovibrio terrae TaxID=2922866 RepID=UPI001FAEDB2D|nr:hypothetical protein [Fundidesulfovibrio terrae]
MATIKERIEAVFAAQAFAERNLDQEALEILGEARSETKTVAVAGKRTDTRPRLRA